MADNDLDRAVATLRAARNSALTGAIDVCKDLAARGGSAADCVFALRLFQKEVDAILAERVAAALEAVKSTH